MMILENTKHVRGMKNMSTSKWWLMSLLGLAVFYASASAHASPVWQVSDGVHRLYLTGSIHLLRPSDYPLPAGFGQAYRKSDRLVFETDIAAIESEKAQRMMLRFMMFDNGETIHGRINQATKNKINQALKTYLPQMSLAQIGSFRPGFLLGFLEVSALQKEGFSAKGVDQHFALKALEDGKPILQFESLEEQAKILAKVGMKKPNAFLAHGLDMLLENFDARIIKAMGQWRRGDADELFMDSFAALEKADPGSFAIMLKNRNEAWLAQINKLIKDKPVEMVVVGFGHFGGTHGLLAGLKKQGYRIEQIK